MNFMWFKDFCVLVEFVNRLHPWHIDYVARQWIKKDIASGEVSKRRDLIEKRYKELKNDT